MNGQTLVHPNHKANSLTLIFLSSKCDQPQGETLKTALSPAPMTCPSVFVTLRKTHFSKTKINGFSAGLFELNTITTTSVQSGTKGLDSSIFGTALQKVPIISSCAHVAAKGHQQPLATGKGTAQGLVFCIVKVYRS